MAKDMFTFTDFKPGPPTMLPDEKYQKYKGDLAVGAGALEQDGVAPYDTGSGLPPDKLDTGGAFWGHKTMGNFHDTNPI